MHNRRENFIVITILGLMALILYAMSDKSREYTQSDAEGYYMYLPALTKYGFKDLPVRSTGQFSTVESTGKYYDKYTAGVAILQLPFYGITYIYVWMHKNTNPAYIPDGYSRPFQHAILLAALFYAFIGLFVLYKILRKEYSPLIVSLREPLKTHHKIIIYDSRFVS